MKVGDLVLNSYGEAATLLSEPRLSEDCEPGGEHYPEYMYYVADVLVTEFGCKDLWITDELEIINANR